MAYVGEVDDGRLLPAIDAWLGGKLPFNQFSRQVDSADRHGTTLLMVAAAFGKVKVVKRLLSAGAHPEQATANHAHARRLGV